MPYHRNVSPDLATFLDGLRQLIEAWERIARRTDPPAEYRPYAEGYYDGVTKAAETGASELRALIKHHVTR